MAECQFRKRNGHRCDANAHPANVSFHESQVLSFQATLTNLLNQHSVVSYWQGFNSSYFTSQFFPSGQNVFGGAAFYQAAETGYDPTTAANNSGLIKNNNYGHPNLRQLSRNIRLFVLLCDAMLESEFHP